MKTRYRYIMLPIVLITLLAALSMPVSAEYGPSACPCVTKYTGTINGDIYYKYYGGTFSQSESTVFTGIPDGIITAKVYTGVWGGSPGSPSCPDGGTFQIEVNGNASPGYVACDPGEPEEDRCGIVNEPECRDSVTGCQVHHITYNATPYIVSGDNTVTVTTSNTGCCGSWDGRIYFIALLVVYEDASMPEITYWINEGAVYMDVGSGCSPHADEAFIYFNGTISPASISNVEYWTYGEPNNLAVNPDLNGNNIGNPDPDSEGRVKWNHISPAHLNASSNLFYYYDPDGCYNRAQFAVLKLSSSSETGPDLVVTDIDVGTPRPDNASTVTATIKNQGNENIAGHFNVSLQVGGASNSTVNVTTGLDAGNSTTVSFTNVNESPGCYSFKVFADCENVSAEVIETNNNMTVDGQVGYVIVVDGNFSDLVEESNNGLLGSGNVTQIGNTYYIRNFTGSSAIKNCAGNGITIKNTDDLFVITNCTVHECSAEGVYFYNVTNGTVNDSTVEDNSGKGIRIQKSTYVNITNNTVQNNMAYGIDVYPETLLPENIDDSKFVNISYNTLRNNSYGIELIGFNCTVCNNTIRNNTAYGIYIYGNNSNIMYNNITYNDDYGVKVYTSSYNNYIYENNFTDNNADNSGHQGYDSGTNYWNVTTKGNYWSDWKDNSGFPSNYTIDDGSNADERPKGLYDFLTGEREDKWAYRDQVNAIQPGTCDVPSTPFSSDGYGNITVDDGTFQSDHTVDDGYFAAHRFNFSIAEPVSKIARINVTWNGKGWYDKANPASNHGAHLYIWNGTSVSYEELADNAGDDAEATLTGEVTTSISSYINSGNVTVLVVQNTAHDIGGKTYKSNIETDYVKLAVAP